MQGLSLVAASGGHSSSRCAGLSLLRPHFLRNTGSRHAGSVIVARGPSCSAPCGIFPDQGLNPCPLHWQADSQPLRHQGSPVLVSYNPLYFCSVSCEFSLFISIFIDLRPLPFFLDESGQGLISFVYLLRKPAFSFIDLCYCFLCFYIIYFCTDLYDFFPSTDFGFSLFFLLLFF